MSSVFSGAITELSICISKELGKIASLLDITNDEPGKQFIIRIKEDSSRVINYSSLPDILSTVKNGVCYIYMFTMPKKSSKGHPEKNKEVIIKYGDAISYTMVLATKNNANISKNVKKNKMEMVMRIDGSRILYKFLDKYLFMVDSNGSISYYPDSIDILDVNQWVASMNKTIPVSYPGITNIELASILKLNKYVPLECNLNPSAYELTNFENLETVDKQYIKENIPDTSNVTNYSYSRIGYLLSWLNPLSYYSSDVIQSNTHSNLDKPIHLEPTYYLDSNASGNFDIIKMDSNKIKRLKCYEIDIPVFITDILVNDIDEVNFIGRIDTTPITIKYNKYMVNRLIC